MKIITIIILLITISAICKSQSISDINYNYEGDYAAIQKLKQDVALLKQQINSKESMKKSDSSGSDIMDAIYVCGLWAIRHDALCRFKFVYAHQLKKEIKILTNKKP